MASFSQELVGLICLMIIQGLVQMNEALQLIRSNFEYAEAEIWSLMEVDGCYVYTVKCYTV